jgi:hypothetical protein
MQRITLYAGLFFTAIVLLRITLFLHGDVVTLLKFRITSVIPHLLIVRAFAVVYLQL